jgi:UDP-N-acetylmuramate--alanine ligase
VREGFGSRTIAVFQPHRYSRTRALLEEFGGAFHLADIVFVTDIYPAGEEPVPGLDGSVVQDALVRHGHPDVRYEKDHDRIVKQLGEILQPGDVVLTLGAGDVWKIGENLVKSGRKGGRRRP